MTILLSPDQERAVDDVIAFLADPDEHEMAISGPGGTGKSFLTKYILEKARDKSLMQMMSLLLGSDNELNVALTSSTNKAADVLAKATGEATCTIHKLLNLRVLNNSSTGLTQVVKTKKTKVIQRTFIIVDEASMVNKDLLETIRSCTQRCKVLYIGDAYQLAPVRENSSPVFNEIVKQSKLTTIQRQAAGSPIIGFAQEFRTALDTGVFPRVKTTGTAVQLLSEQEFLDQLKESFTDPVKARDSRVITWSNSRVHQYNAFIRGLHTSDTDYLVGEWLITNSPIIQEERLKFPGNALVKITNLSPASAHDIAGWDLVLNKTCQVFLAKDFKDVEVLLKHLAKHQDWATFFQMKEYFVDLRPYFASTTAKAQGSTYKNVFIDVDDIARNTKNSEIARLMYTAITRASDNVYMRGELPARLY